MDEKREKRIEEKLEDICDHLAESKQDLILTTLFAIAGELEEIISLLEKRPLIQKEQKDETINLAIRNRINKAIKILED